jgi:hypothetical protein
MLKWFNIMKKMLFKMPLFRYQIISNYNGIATLLCTYILKMVTNYQHVTYIYTHFEGAARLRNLCCRRKISHCVRNDISSC